MDGVGLKWIRLLRVNVVARSGLLMLEASSFDVLILSAVEDVV